MRADEARVTKARKAMLMVDAEDSVNMSICTYLILFVNGIVDDINRYAIICSKQSNPNKSKVWPFCLANLAGTHKNLFFPPSFY